MTKTLEKSKEYLDEWVRLLKEAHEIHKHPFSGADKCIRCYEYKKIPYLIKLCDTCMDILKTDYPEIYEETRQENIRLFDSL